MPLRTCPPPPGPGPAPRGAHTPDLEQLQGAHFSLAVVAPLGQQPLRQHRAILRHKPAGCRRSARVGGPGHQMRGALAGQLSCAACGQPSGHRQDRAAQRRGHAKPAIQGACSQLLAAIDADEQRHHVGLWAAAASPVQGCTTAAGVSVGPCRHSRWRWHQGTVDGVRMGPCQRRRLQGPHLSTATPAAAGPCRHPLPLCSRRRPRCCRHRCRPLPGLQQAGIGLR